MWILFVFLCGPAVNYDLHRMSLMCPTFGQWQANPRDAERVNWWTFTWMWCVGGIKHLWDSYMTTHCCLWTTQRWIQKYICCWAQVENTNSTSSGVPMSRQMWVKTEYNGLQIPVARQGAGSGVNRKWCHAQGERGEFRNQRHTLTLLYTALLVLFFLVHYFFLPLLSILRGVFFCHFYVPF